MVSGTDIDSPIFRHRPPDRYIQTFSDNQNMQDLKKNILPHCALSIVAAALLIIWPINGTTGLKNLLILTGVILSVYLLRRSESPFKGAMKLKQLPILLFFVWMLFQAHLISPFPIQAQKQLSSVWLPAALAAFLGFSLGLQNGKKNPDLIVRIALLSLPFVYFLNYLVVCIQNENFSIPVFNTDLGWYGDKTKIIFFGLLSLATSLHLLFKSIQKKEKKNILIFSCCALTSYLSFLLVGSKSGVVQGVILFFLALLLVMRNHISKQARLILIPLGLFMCVAGIWQIKNDAGWANFRQSIQAGIDIEKFDNWKNYPASGLPVVDGKYQTQESAYLRANGIVLGIKCLITQPLGHGNLSEPLKRTRGTCELATKTAIFTTLSALLDFSLVVGLPGIILLLAIFFTAFSSREVNDSNPLPLSKIASLSIMSTWIFSEISDTHYYESTFFMLSMLISSHRLASTNPENVAAAG